MVLFERHFQIEVNTCSVGGTGLSYILAGLHRDILVIRYTVNQVINPPTISPPGRGR